MPNLEKRKEQEAFDPLELRDMLVNNDIDFHEYNVGYNTINSIYRDLFKDK